MEYYLKYSFIILRIHRSTQQLTTSCHRQALWDQLFFASVCVSVTQSCPTLCNPANRSPPGSTVHGILQARMGSHSFLQGILLTQGSNPRVSCIAGRLFTIQFSIFTSQVSVLTLSHILNPKSLTFRIFKYICPKITGISINCFTWYPSNKKTKCMLSLTTFTAFSSIITGKRTSV